MGFSYDIFFCLLQNEICLMVYGLRSYSVGNFLAGNVNEAGCDEDHHCQGGALCVDNICQCPSRYLPVARDSKCAKIGGENCTRLFFNSNLSN